MIRRDDSTTTDMAITLEGGGVVTLNYAAGVQFPPGSVDAIAFIEALLFNDPSNMTRISLKDLRKDFPDDEDGDIDPGIGITRPAMFWVGPGQPGNTDLVSVSSYFTVRWYVAGEKYLFSSHRARRV